MKALPVRLFHASLSGLLTGILLMLFVFHVQQRFVAQPKTQDLPMAGEYDLYTPPTPNGTANAVTDTDQDEMPDDWEIENHHDPDNPVDADADFDRDGLTAKDEFLAGTDPAGQWKIVNIGLPPQITGLLTYCEYSPTAPNSYGDFAVELLSYTSEDGVIDAVYFYDYESTGWQVIPKPPGNGTWMGVHDINDSKTLALSAENQGFLWRPDGSFELLDDGSGGPAVAERINNHDEWIGRSSTDGSPVSSISGVVSSDQNSWATWQYTDINDYGETMGVFSLPMQEPRTFLAYGNWFYPTGYPGEFPFFDAVSGVYNWPSAMNNWGEFVGSAHDVPYSSSLPFLFDGEYREINIAGAGTSPLGIDSYGRALTSIGLFSEGVGIRLSDLSAEIPDGPAAFGISANSIILLADDTSSSGITGFKLLIPDQDQDGDGMPDDWETAHGLNLNDPSDAHSDPDGDGTSNYGEFLLRSNPNAPPVFDPNGNEIDTRHGIDTDGDGMPNVWEWENGMDYIDASDAAKDYDRDGYTNLQEFQLNSDPRGAPAYRLRELGPLEGFSSASLTAAVLGDGAVSSDGIRESVYFTGTPVSSSAGGTRPVEWALNRNAEQGASTFFPSVGSTNTTLCAQATGGAALSYTATSPRMFYFWKTPTSPAVQLSGAATENNVYSLQSAKLSPGGDFLAARRQLASSTASYDLVVWKMPQGPSQVYRPVTLTAPTGVTLSSSPTFYVNDYGYVTATATSAGRNAIVRWQVNELGTTATPIVLTLPNEGISATVSGISNQETPVIVGTVTLSNNQTRAAVWSQNGTVTELAMPEGVTNAITYAVSPGGMIAGRGSVLVNGSLRYRFFTALWRASTASWSVQLQGDPVPSLTFRGINDDGEILGITSSLATPELWRNGRAYPLSPSIPANSGFTLTALNAINPNGTLIGTGYRNGTLITVLLTPDRDTDGDGLPDAFENQHSFNAFVKNTPATDTDADGLNDIEEFRNGTNPRNPDSDSDGMKDGWEVSWGLLPLDPSDAPLDPDNDSVSNLRESEINSNPTGIYKVLNRYQVPLNTTSFLSADDAGNMILTGSSDSILLLREGETVPIPLPSYSHTAYEFAPNWWHYEENTPTYWLEPEEERVNGHMSSSWGEYNGVVTAEGDESYLLSIADGEVYPQETRNFSEISDSLRALSPPAIAPNETLYVGSSVVSPHGTYRVHRTSAGKNLVLDEMGNYNGPLPSGSWAKINNRAEAFALATKYVPAANGLPSYYAPELRRAWPYLPVEIISIPHQPGISPAYTLRDVTDDGTALLSRTVKNGQLANTTVYELFDIASGTLRTVRRPGLSGEGVPLLSRQNTRLLGSGTRPYCVTPDGTSIQLAALRIKNNPTDPAIPFGTLYPKTLTPNHIASDGRITLTTSNAQNQTTILQIVPHNDADGDGLPDDWEHSFSESILERNPSLAGLTPEQTAHVQTGNLDPSLDYTGEEISTEQQFELAVSLENPYDPAIKLGYWLMRKDKRFDADTSFLEEEDVEDIAFGTLSWQIRGRPLKEEDTERFESPSHRYAKGIPANEVPELFERELPFGQQKWEVGWPVERIDILPHGEGSSAYTHDVWDIHDVKETTSTVKAETGEFRLLRSGTVEGPIAVNVLEVTSRYLLAEDETTDKVVDVKTKKFEIPANGTQSNTIQLDLPPFVDGYAYERTLLLVDLISDLNNDGEINSADNTLRDKALESEITDEEKDKGTEFLFVNDKISNGLGDVEDSKAQAGTTDDDDIQEIKVTIAAESGIVDFDHPAIDKLKFFEDKPCEVQVEFPFDLAAKDLPEVLHIRTESEFDGQIEGDLVLKYKPKADAEEIEAVKLKLTVVHRVGDKKYFHAARDYMKELNSKLCVRQEKTDKNGRAGYWRLITMLHEKTSMKTVDSYHRDPKLKGIGSVVGSYGSYDVAVNGNFCHSSSPPLWAKLAGLRYPEKGGMTDRCDGIYITGKKKSIVGVSDNGDGLAGPKAEYIGYNEANRISISTGHVPINPIIHDEALGGFSARYVGGSNSGWHPWYGIAEVGQKKVFFVATPYVIHSPGGGGPADLKQRLIKSGVPNLPGGDPGEIMCVSGDGGSSIGLAYRLNGQALKVTTEGGKHIAAVGLGRQQGDYFINTYLLFKTQKTR